MDQVTWKTSVPTRKFGPGPFHFKWVSTFVNVEAEIRSLRQVITSFKVTRISNQCSVWKSRSKDNKNVITLLYRTTCSTESRSSIWFDHAINHWNYDQLNEVRQEMSCKYYKHALLPCILRIIFSTKLQLNLNIIKMLLTLTGRLAVKFNHLLNTCVLLCERPEVTIRKAGQDFRKQAHECWYFFV